MSSRSYLINGIEWPSVTTILDMLGKGDALIQWAANCAVECVRQNALDMDFEDLLHYAKGHWREVREEAADIGGEVHQLAKVYIRHGRDAMGSYRKEVENGFLAFLEWEKVNKITWLESEKEVFDRVHGYAGTLDAKCRFGAGRFIGRVFVIDFKSSKAFWDGMEEQVCAYRNADDMNTTLPADGCGILRLDKATGEPEFKDCSDRYQKRLDFFFKLVEAYYLQKDRRLKGNPLTLSGRDVAARGKKTLADLKAEKAASAAAPADWNPAATAAAPPIPADAPLGAWTPAPAKGA